MIILFIWDRLAEYDVVTDPGMHHHRKKVSTKESSTPNADLRTDAMSFNRTPPEQTDEEILTCEVPDDVLEAAGSMAKTAALSFSFCTSVYVCPWWG